MTPTTLKEAINTRHSVRKYMERPIDPETAAKLNSEIDTCNAESGLSIQLILNDPECFRTIKSYGFFRNVVNYIALVGSDDDALFERCGYYGERLVLFAETLGLKTCWVAGSYSKGSCKAIVEPGQKLACVISVGYGETEGVPHRSKPIKKICTVKPNEMEEWFRAGVEAALLAPTAINQQQFVISLEGGEPVITPKRGPFSEIDLGIVKFHFEIASGRKCR